jgi:hypothetical protein
MELNVPTIAQRKAARRNQSLVTETTSQSSDKSTEIMQESPAQILPEQTSSKAVQYTGTTEVEVLPERQIQSPISDIKIDKETLFAIARSMGLELKAPKKIWIKHSYSVTPESKQKFADYCDVLGIKMQDGLEEALQEWFLKKEAEFKAVSKAKSTE